MNLRRIALLIPLAALFSCGKSDPAPAPNSPAGAVPAITWNTSSGVALASIDAATRARLNIHAAVRAPDGLPVVFATLGNTTGDAPYGPVIARTVAGVDRVMEFVGPDNQLVFPAHEWKAAGAVGTAGEMIGVLDTAAPGPTLTLVRTTDAGLTWTALARLKKPHATAVFNHVVMTTDGKIHIETRVKDPIDGVQRGAYHFRSADAGKTWTGPDHEPDDFTPGDDAPLTLDRALHPPPPAE